MCFNPLYCSPFLSLPSQFSTLACNFRAQNRERPLSLLSLPKNTKNHTNNTEAQTRTPPIIYKHYKTLRAKHRRNLLPLSSSIPFFCFLLYHLSLEREILLYHSALPTLQWTRVFVGSQLGTAPILQFLTN